MPAYVISQVTLHSGVALDNYRAAASASIELHGGRYLARGGRTSVLEGDWVGETIIVEFPSVAQARAWYDSADYAKALAFRDEALSRNLVIVEGLE